MNSADANAIRSDRSIRTLLLINAGLLVLLGVVTFGSAAIAQAARGRGEYTMVGGGVNGANSSAAYIIDVANQEMIALTYDHNTKLLEGVGYRNLARDAEQLVRPTRPLN